MLSSVPGAPPRAAVGSSAAVGGAGQKLAPWPEYGLGLEGYAALQAATAAAGAVSYSLATSTSGHRGTLSAAPFASTSVGSGEYSSSEGAGGAPAGGAAANGGPRRPKRRRPRRRCRAPSGPSYPPISAYVSTAGTVERSCYEGAGAPP
jgi:hypothetical protein